MNNTDIFFNNLFECENFACNCVKDIENVAPDIPPKTTLKLYSDSTRLLTFSYAPREGLNLTGVAGGLIEKNILGKLLAIPDGDIDKHIDFFVTYGFLLPLKEDEYESINAEDLLGIVNRIKATIQLMNSIGKRNFRSILVNVAYLLYSPQIEVRFSDYTFSTCYHRFTQLIETYNLFPDISREDEVAALGTYSVADTMLGKINHIDFRFYNAVRQNGKTDITGSNTKWFKNLTAAYVGCHNESEDVRTLIDFFFHFQTEISAFKEVEFRRIVPFSHVDEESFSEEIKTALLKIARIVVSEEINFNIAGVHPKYDGSRLSAVWQVDTLLQALYFSIFYMKAGVEIYKECENPNCKRDRYFLVEATRTNKKYCCQQCANAAASQRHRNRNLEVKG